MAVGVIASEVSRVERRGQIDGKIPAGSKKSHVNLGQNILIAATTSSAEGKGTQEDTIRCLPERPGPHSSASESSWADVSLLGHVKSARRPLALLYISCF